MIEKNQHTQRKPLFALGHLVATPGALQALEESDENAAAFIARHLKGDWGKLCNEDRKANDAAVEQGLRILSSYTTSTGTKLWIITEADRSVTTLLLPSEY